MEHCTVSMKMIVPALFSLLFTLSSGQNLTIETRQVQCIPLGLACIPNSQVQTCCIAQGQTCKVNPAIPNSFTCQAGGSVPGNCLPLGTACIPGNEETNQKCCTAQGQSCKLNPAIPNSFSCQADIPGTCLSESSRCNPESTLPAQMCCMSSGLACTASRQRPNEHTCKLINEACIDDRQPCKKNEGPACCRGRCYMNIFLQYRCPVRIFGLDGGETLSYEDEADTELMETSIDGRK